MVLQSADLQPEVLVQTMGNYMSRMPYSDCGLSWVVKIGPVSQKEDRQTYLSTQVKYPSAGSEDEGRYDARERGWRHVMTIARMSNLI